MTQRIDEAWPDLDAGSPGLVRMRRYTTWTMVAVVACYVCLISLAQSRSVPLLAVLLAVGALVCWQCVHWERGARPAILGPALTASYALLWVIAVSHRNPADGVAFYISAALATSVPPFTRWRWNGLAVALAIIPVAAFDDSRAVVGAAASPLISMTSRDRRSTSAGSSSNWPTSCSTGIRSWPGPMCARRSS
jgi:two-component system sensor histidine kinase DesK